MKRRTFIAGLGAAAAWPLAARGQRPVPTVGFLGANVADTFIQAMDRLGWIAGRNVHLEVRSAAGKPFAPLASELVGLSPEVLVASGTPALTALRQATSTIPIVFANISDPVGQGFVASLSRPDSNVTGFMNFESSIGGKWVQMLREILPGLSHVAVIFNPQLAPQTEYFVPVIERVSRELSLKPIITRYHDETELDHALAELSREFRPGMVVPPGLYTPAFRKKMIEAMERYRIPAIYWSRLYATEGGLMAYGSDENDLYRGAASYVDRILKGTRLTDLPVQTPTKFELVINLKTAKGLGLAIPNDVLALADEVIE